MWLSSTCCSWCRHLSGPTICLWNTTGAESKLNTVDSDPLFINGCRSEFTYKTHTFRNFVHHCWSSLRLEKNRRETFWHRLRVTQTLKRPPTRCAKMFVHLMSQCEVFSILKSQTLSFGTVFGQLHRCLTTLSKQSTMRQECLVFPWCNC